MVDDDLYEEDVKRSLAERPLVMATTKPEEAKEETLTNKHNKHNNNNQSPSRRKALLVLHGVIAIVGIVIAIVVPVSKILRFLHPKAPCPARRRIAISRGRRWM